MNLKGDFKMDEGRRGRGESDGEEELRERKKVGGAGVVTARDVAIVGWLGRHRLATAEQVARRFGMQRTKAYARLRVLDRAGLVRAEQPLRGAGVFLATRRGLERSGVDLAPARVALGTLEHDLAIVDVSIDLELKAGARVTTDRELRRAIASRGDREVAVTMVPDLVAELGDERLAVEVELSRKARDRVRAKLDHYAGSGRYAHVVYYVPDATSERWLSALVSERSTGAVQVAVRRLVDRSTLPAPRGLEAEVRAFVAAGDAERARLLAAWQLRYASDEAEAAS